MPNNTAARILVVDDEAAIRRSLSGILADEGYEAALAEDGEKALAAVRERAPDAVLLDIAMPGRDGTSVLEELRRTQPALPVVMMSGHGTIETAVRATQLGAFDFIEKPLSLEKLLLTLRHALEKGRLERENRELRAKSLRAHEILGDSLAMQRLREKIALAAPTPGWVLITGENGTGKELVAKQLHLLGKRSLAPFVEVNCAAIPEELIESELFGHEKGAFTGAIAQKRGRFELANGGTIFLDEIGDMSLRTQAKILRVLEERNFQRVGGTEPIEIDVRVIAATNKNLEQEIARGAFREDLYYRLNVIPFRVPPLRERREDIPGLARAFVDEACDEAGVPRKKLDPKALAALAAYDWPGNVRELKNLVTRVVLMTPDAELRQIDLPHEIRAPADGRRKKRGALEEARRDFERRFLLAKLDEHGGNISRTAEAIGIARESLSRKLRALKIQTQRGE
jgi:two-component system nitrogen regulation response regulator NtrX